MPSRNDTVTATCGACGDPLPAGRARAWCSDACRQAAWRRRHQPLVAPPELPAAQPRKPATVYECANCGSRLLGEQYCADCGTFMHKIGYGGECPHCTELVAINELARP